MTLQTGNLGPYSSGKAGNTTTAAEVFRQDVIAVWARQGIVQPGDLLVSQHAGTINRSVDIAEGMAIIYGTSTPTKQGAYRVWNNVVDNTVAFPVANATNNTPYIVGIVQNDASFDGGSLNDPVFTLLTGTAGGTVPNLPTLVMAGLPAMPASFLPLAYVVQLAGSAGNTIDNAHILDVRGTAGMIGRNNYYDKTGGTVLTTSAGTEVGTGLTLTVPAQGFPYRIRVTVSLGWTATVLTDQAQMLLYINGVVVRNKIVLCSVGVTGQFTGGDLTASAVVNPDAATVVALNIVRRTGTGTFTTNGDVTYNQMHIEAIPL